MERPLKQHLDHMTTIIHDRTPLSKKASVVSVCDSSAGKTAACGFCIRHLQEQSCIFFLKKKHKTKRSSLEKKRTDLQSYRSHTLVPLRYRPEKIFGITIRHLTPSKYINSHLNCMSAEKTPHPPNVKGTMCHSVQWSMNTGEGKRIDASFGCSRFLTARPRKHWKLKNIRTKQTLVVSPFGTRPISDKMAHRNGKRCMLDRGNKP